MPEPIRCGILGAGHVHALEKLQTLQSLADYELIGVCEPDDAVRAGWQMDERFDGVRWMSRDDLLGDASVQMIAVESATPQLLEFARVAIEAGKHIHLDKPAGTCLAEFRSLLDEAQRRHLAVQMGYMFRYSPGFDFLRRALREGWLGDVYSIQASMCTDMGPTTRRKLAYHPGGVMLEVGCHMIDMIVLMLGRPSKVTSFLRHEADIDDGFNDNALAALEYDRAIAVVETSALELDAFPKRRFKVAGTAGTAILEPFEPASVDLCLRTPVEGFTTGWQSVELKDKPRYVRDLQDLARCIRQEKALSYTCQHDYNVQETLLRACEASR